MQIGTGLDFGHEYPGAYVSEQESYQRQRKELDRSTQMLSILTASYSLFSSSLIRRTPETLGGSSCFCPNICSLLPNEFVGRY